MAERERGRGTEGEREMKLVEYILSFSQYGIDVV